MRRVWSIIRATVSSSGIAPSEEVNRVDIDNTTITDNVAGGTGGGIHASEFDPDFGSRTRLGSTIVSQNMPTDLHHETVFTGQDPIFSRGGNFVGIGNATTRFSASEVFGVTDPLLDALAAAVGEYPAAVWVKRRGDRVIAELEDGDLAGLNAWLAGRGTHVSHLALEARTLEDAFMEATGAADREAGSGLETGSESGDHRMEEIQ